MSLSVPSVKLQGPWVKHESIISANVLLPSFFVAVSLTSQIQHQTVDNDLSWINMFCRNWVLAALLHFHSALFHSSCWQATSLCCLITIVTHCLASALSPQWASRIPAPLLTLQLCQAILCKNAGSRWLQVGEQRFPFWTCLDFFDCPAQKLMCVYIVI